jgi:hypothetical protein
LWRWPAREPLATSVRNTRDTWVCNGDFVKRAIFFVAMTRKEFSANFDAYMRSGSPRGIWIACAITALITATPLLSDFLEKHYGAGLSNVFLLITFFGLLGAVTVAAIALHIPLVKKFGLKCPACGCGLVDYDRRKKVFLTGQCPKCRNKVFDDDSARSCGLEREEFKAKFENFNRQSRRKSIRALIILFVAIIPCVLVAKYFEHLVDDGGLDWVTVTEWKWFAGALLIAFFAFVFGIVAFGRKGKLNTHPLPCPECNRSLVGFVGRAAVETGMCIYCSCRLFEGRPVRKVRSPI